ncbi:something about silencing protein 10 isoform X1 [Salmo salar]|uniref:Something about silencing protein 10 isoform X1 n=1 Tax=Salmo salar TaxID=8030 RepID=A0A1S3P2I1_SALSA|nr:something about silencing protein 10 isoform X1 [Salmo salar]|eukprot:XP_014021746.1 PREDICTED: something about silencing protein 10 isoform X1 [Salmo salar]
MVRALRTKRAPTVKKTEQFDEDDPKAYKDMPVPDKRSSQYTKDKIDEFHDDKIAKLLARGVQMDSDQEDGDDEEEVMALDLTDSEEDDDEEEEEKEEEADMDSDLEGKKEDGLPNDMAWGNRKKMFYDSDYVAAKGKSQQDAEADDEEEEEEAKNIQRRLAVDLSEEDYDLNLLQEFAVEEQGVEKERIVKDLKQMSQKEKMKLLKKESPELLELIQDFKSKLAELKDELQPLLEMVNDGRIPPGKGANYLKTKQQLYLNYCTNISFYLVLKAKRIPAHNHPVIERLLTYRNLINEMGEVDARLAPQLCQLLSADQKEKSARKSESSKQITNKKVKVSEEARAESSEDSNSDLDEEAALRFYRGVEERLKLKRKSKSKDPQVEEGRLEEAGDDEVDPDAKRRITYQMAKNKGLTPKRKKIDRNPRVKHREKFRRAKIRRKGQVREVRREETRYSGELSGIRAGVKKSVKLK